MLKKLFDKVLHAPKASAGMFDEFGAIKLDPTPMVEHLPDINSGMSMREALEQFLSRESYRRLQEAAGEETFEDFLDFGDEREPDFPGSPYSVEDERMITEANKRVREASVAPPQEPPEVPPQGGVSPPRRGKGEKVPKQMDLEDDQDD